MPHKTYKTEYSNHVHQLVVSVSRHYYVTSNGKFKQQKKALGGKLGCPATYTKKHIVHYLIRDHFSGLFYAEVTDTDNILSVLEFLKRAWSAKEGHPLQGIPNALTVPHSVRTVWPEIIPFLDAFSIQPVDVTSGFQGGVRDIRTWEEHLRTGLYESGFPPDYSEVRAQAAQTCAFISTYGSNGPKADIWRDNLHEDIYIPPFQSTAATEL